MQPLTVIAVRPAGRLRSSPSAASPCRSRPSPGAVPLASPSARPALQDLDAVTELELGVIRYDALFGAAIIRPATEALVRAETQAALAARPAWAWLAEQDGRPVGLVHVQPPGQSRLDRRHGARRHDGLPADHVRPAR